MTPTLTTTTTTYTIGGAANTWGRTWTVTQGREHDSEYASSTWPTSTARTFSLDGVAVRVTYQ